MMKRRITAAAAALLLVLVLCVAACGGKNNSASTSEYAVNNAKVETGSYEGAAKAESYDSYAAEETADTDTLADEAASGEEPEAVESAESRDKLVYKCWMTIQTLTFSETQDYVREAVSKVGGIIESESVSDSNYSWYNEEYKKIGTLNASLTVRVPSDKYNEFLEMLEGSGGKIVNKSQNVENITKRYNDQSIYIESLEMQEQRLLEMMKQAETVDEMITVEARLTDVQTELNQARSDLAVMDTDVKYSTVNLTLEEVVRYTDSPKTPVAFSERVAEAFVDSWENFVDLLQGLVISVIYLLPAIVFIALIAAVVFLIRKAWRKKHPKVKKEKRPNPRAYDQRPFRGNNGGPFRGNNGGSFRNENTNQGRPVASADPESVNSERINPESINPVNTPAVEKKPEPENKK